MARPIKKQVVTKATKQPGIMPLDYMISVIRDPTATQERRDRMAIAAAPYCHPRLTYEQPIKGKKDQQTEAAWKAGMGTAWMKDLEFENRTS
jgi:hypothetical protein